MEQKSEIAKIKNKKSDLLFKNCTPAKMTTITKRRYNRIMSISLTEEMFGTQLKIDNPTVCCLICGWVGGCINGCFEF